MYPDDIAMEYETNMNWVDWSVIVLYFILVLGIGFWASVRASRDSAAGYFLAGRVTTWIPIGCSTFATNIGAPMFIGLAGSAAASGIGVVMFEWHAMWMLILLGWVFMPVYLACGIYTLPEYLRMRFGGQRIRVWLAIIHTLLTIISQIAGQMYAGVLFIKYVFGWPLYATVLFILIITATYTIVGGLTAVIWTDTIQTLILLFGATICSIICLNSLGSFEVMRELFFPSASMETYYNESLNHNLSCGFPPEDSMHIFREPSDPDYPWPGMVFGLTILALSAWCTDQICVQRSLSAKSLTHAKAGVLLAAYLKILPFFFFIIPGMIARILFPNHIACADPEVCFKMCANEAGCTNMAYPILVSMVLPTGIRGLMMAALLSALMSSLTSYFNSSSTIFCMDLWRRMRPRCKEGELMVVGRLWTVFLAVCAILWLPILNNVQGAKFWDYSQAISSYINPPIVMVFLFGFFWKRTTEKAAFWSLVIGLFIGLTRMILDWGWPGEPCGSTEESKQLPIVANVHYLYFACILAGCCTVVILVMSPLTQPRRQNQLHRVTWWTRHDEEFPDVTDESDIEEDDDQVAWQDLNDADRGCCEKTKLFTLKWLCGIDKLKKPKEKLTREELLEVQKRLTSIGEDPFWKSCLDINAAVCACVCVFLHFFWY